MKNLIIINKKEGETPLHAMEAFRRKNKAYKDLKMTYAGRLDPMATGLLLILAGEETKNKEKYLGLSKEYSFEVLFGFSTDTYDILGKVTNSSDSFADLEDEIKKNLKHFKGTFSQKYPIYSSRTVNGRPLFEYGRSGEEVEVPEREVSVKSIKFLKIKKISSKVLLKNIGKRIAKVEGDFRQKEVLDIWKKELKKDSLYFIGSFHIKCSSGTYVRSIANSLGEKLCVPALAYSIKREKVGRYSIK